MEISRQCHIADKKRFRYGSVIDAGRGHAAEWAGEADGRPRHRTHEQGNGLGGTLTRADLADVVHSRLGLSRAESAQLVERVLHHMCHSLSEGRNVKISGFGSFILRDKGERVGRNPKTGIEASIAPRRVMTFRASQIMRDRISR